MMRITACAALGALAGAAWCSTGIARLAVTVELRPGGFGHGWAIVKVAGRPVMAGAYVQGQDGALVWSREVTLVNFPDVRTYEAWSREVTLGQRQSDPDALGNAWSREVTLHQSPDVRVVQAWSRELALNNQAGSATEPIQSAWSRELTMVQTPDYVVYGTWSRELALNNRAGSETGAPDNWWAREQTLGNLYIPAIGILAEKGRLVSGQVGDLGERDGREVVVRADGPRAVPGDSEIADSDLLRLRIEGQSSVQAPSRIDVVLFGRASVGRIDQIVELYDWLNLRYEEVFRGPAPTTNTETLARVSSGAARFVNANAREIRARVRYVRRADGQPPRVGTVQMNLEQAVFVTSR